MAVVVAGVEQGKASFGEVALVSELNRRVSGSRRGTWCAVHPVNYARDPGKPPQRHREPDFCSCGMQRSLTGVCDICD